MAHNIPKIVYGALNTTINFTYPAKEDGPEEYDIKDTTTLSLSGVRQTSLNFIEAIEAKTFSFVSEAILAQIQAFILNHAALGNSFRYYDDGTSLSYVEYELAPGFKFKPMRESIAGVNAYNYKVPLTFRRVVGEASTDMITATIANNQAVAAVVTGLVFDHTLYSSVKIFCEIRRKTDSSENIANGYLTAVYKTSTSTWDITPGGTFDGDAHGCTFSMSAEQVKYVSDNQAGTNYVGTIKIKDMVFA